jgi:aminoglycoside 3-N-acetyltransferase
MQTSMVPREHRVEEIAAQLLALGVRAGGVLLVHTSYRAVRPVEGGPVGLIRALQQALGPEGTLVMPTMTDGETVFDPQSTSSTGMGITAELFWRTDGVIRSTHPGGSFAARGPHARQICAPQPLSPPHGPDSPPGRVHELGGQVLLLGVEHSESTLLHVAESLGRVPYSVFHPTVVEVDGEVRRVLVAETDHCCRGFRQVGDWLAARGQERRGRVGNAYARLAAARDIVSVALVALAQDPLVFLCPAQAGCEECDAARLSVTDSAPG